MLTLSKIKTNNRSILDIMKDGALVVKYNEPVYKAISTMISRRVSSLPVVDENSFLVGIISEKDVLRLLYDIHFDGGLVENYMTKKVVTFDCTDSVDCVLKCFKGNSFRRVAIVDDGKLMSMVDRRDVIYLFKDEFKNIDEYTKRDDDDEFTAKDVMTHGLFTVREDVKLGEAVDLILKRNVSGLPVVDENQNLKGIISEKDIIDAIGSEQPYNKTVGELMTEEVVSFGADISLYEICNCLINNNFRRVTILDGEKLVGIISRANIINFILQYRTAVKKQKVVHENRIA